MTTRLNDDIPNQKLRIRILGGAKGEQIIELPDPRISWIEEFNKKAPDGCRAEVVKTFAWVCALGSFLAEAILV